jgi:Type IV secretion system pilin
MKKQFTHIASVLVLTAGPFTVFAAATSFDALVTQLLNYIKLLVPFIIALAMLVFLWGIFKLVFAGGNELDVKEGTKFMTWGIVSLFVMVSVWGLVAILTKTFFDGNPVLPQLKSTMLIEQHYSNRV